MCYHPSHKRYSDQHQQLCNELAEAQLTYLTLLQQDNYPPGKQPIQEDKRLHALQAQVKTLTDKMGSLACSPDATSTTGNDKGPTDKTVYVPYKDRDPNALAANGLTNAVCIQAKAATIERFKNMPKDLSTVLTTEELSISVNGKVVGKWCTTCLRFVLGKHMHFTLGHKGPAPRLKPTKTNIHSGQTSAPADPAPAPAAGLLASIPAPPPGPPVVSPPTFQPPASYDFCSTETLQRGTGLLAQTAPSDEDSVLSDNFHGAPDISDIDLTEVDPGLLALLGLSNVVLPKGLGR